MAVTERIMNLLSGMFRPIEGVNRDAWGYHHASGWNDALRQVMDYVRGGAIADADGDDDSSPAAVHQQTSEPNKP
jgi:hypothetical protein